MRSDTGEMQMLVARVAQLELQVTLLKAQQRRPAAPTAPAAPAKTCGQHGGVTNKGKPCKNPAGVFSCDTGYIGRCRHHRWRRNVGLKTKPHVYAEWKAENPDANDDSPDFH
jgi:hypothetical protein